MSISSVGSSPGSGASQYLAELLSRLKASSTSATTAATTDTTTAPASSTDQTDTSNAATGAQSPTLSDQVIGALVMMQAQNSAPPDASATAASDPISQAFASMDTDGSGTLSQSELETAIENAGGTAGEADTVFTALGGTASSDVSESSFAQAAQQGAPPPGGPQQAGGAHHHHHHRHGGGSQDATQSAASIFSSLDTNGDGSVSADELSAALSGTAGATSGATTGTSSGSTSSSSDIFAAIDANGDGSISQNELTSYLGNLQQQAQSDQSQLNSFMQLATQAYGNSMSMFAQTSGAQSAMA